jgi:hypothetical protein
LAEVDPDQEAALRRLRAAFGFVEVPAGTQRGLIALSNYAAFPTSFELVFDTLARWGPGTTWT